MRSANTSTGSRAVWFGSTDGSGGYYSGGGPLPMGTKRLLLLDLHQAWETLDLKAKTSGLCGAAVGAVLTAAGVGPVRKAAVSVSLADLRFNPPEMIDIRAVDRLRHGKGVPLTHGAGHGLLRRNAHPDPRFGFGRSGFGACVEGLAQALESKFGAARMREMLEVARDDLRDSTVQAEIVNLQDRSKVTGVADLASSRRRYPPTPPGRLPRSMPTCGVLDYDAGDRPRPSSSLSPMLSPHPRAARCSVSAATSARTDIDVIPPPGAP